MEQLGVIVLLITVSCAVGLEQLLQHCDSEPASDTRVCDLHAPKDYTSTRKDESVRSLKITRWNAKSTLTILHLKNLRFIFFRKSVDCESIHVRPGIQILNWNKEPICKPQSSTADSVEKLDTLENIVALQSSTYGQRCTSAASAHIFSTRIVKTSTENTPVLQTSNTIKVESTKLKWMVVAIVLIVIVLLLIFILVVMMCKRKRTRVTEVQMMDIMNDPQEHEVNVVEIHAATNQPIARPAHPYSLRERPRVDYREGRSRKEKDM